MNLRLNRLKVAPRAGAWIETTEEKQRIINDYGENGELPI